MDFVNQFPNEEERLQEGVRMPHPPEFSCESWKELGREWIEDAKRQSTIHGNSQKSSRPTWGYRLRSYDGLFSKIGITSELVPESTFTKAFMSDKVMIEKILFPSRRDARNWEGQQNHSSRRKKSKNGNVHGGPR